MKELVFALIASIAVCAPAHAGPMKSITKFLADVATGQAELGPQTPTEWIAMRCLALYGALEYQAAKRNDGEKLTDFINRAAAFDAKVGPTTLGSIHSPSLPPVISMIRRSYSLTGQSATMAGMSLWCDRETRRDHWDG